MNSLISFTKYRKFEAVNKEELDLAVDYICGNLNSSSCNYPYWYDMYCYANKSRIVIRHREHKNETAIAKLGECVCKDQVINFLQNEDNKCNCNEGCASVYFKAIFNFSKNE